MGEALSQKSFAANETALLLKLLAFNLAGMLRGGMEDASPHGWDLRRLQRTVLKGRARLVKHGGRLMVDVARAVGVLWDKLVRRMRRRWRDPFWGRARPRSRRWVPPPAHARLCLLLRAWPIDNGLGPTGMG